MEFNHFINYYDRDEKILFDTSVYPLKTLFPIPNDGIIRPNIYFSNNGVYHYMYTQCEILLDALSCNFLGGVYFLWDRRRKLLKIGCSQNLEQRIHQLINDSKIYAIDDDLLLLGLHPTSPALVSNLEKYYHTLFKSYLYKYEWFQVTLEQFDEIMKKTNKNFLFYVSAYSRFWLFYSLIDLIPKELDTVIDIWPFPQDQVRKMLHFDDLIVNKITLLVQDHKGNIIPFGWKQNDIKYLNSLDIWKDRELICFQKLRIMALNNEERQYSIADSFL